MISKKTARTAIITGVNGQDGHYLAELLLGQGYRIVGLTRSRSASRETMAPSIAERIELCEWDPMNGAGLAGLLRDYRPSQIYNLAGFSSGARMFENSVDMGEVNGLAVTRILEAIRATGIDARFCQASSSEVFRHAGSTPQSEETAPSPGTPYGAAKVYADSIVRIFRRQYSMFACSAILYNHESPRRRQEFVTQKVCRGAAMIKLGLAASLELENLDARRDWGFAGDYMRGMQMMLSHHEPDDFVFSSGVLHSVRDLCDVAFSHLSMDYRDFVRSKPQAMRAPETVDLVGINSKAASILGWKPMVSFSDLVCLMVDAQMRSLS